MEIIKCRTPEEIANSVTVSLNYEGYKSFDELINSAIKNTNVNTNVISDGYHNLWRII